AECRTRHRIPGDSSVEELGLLAVREDPSDPDSWDCLLSAVRNVGAIERTSIGFAAWFPEEPDAWNIFTPDMNAKAAWLSRSFTLSHWPPLWGMNYARTLLLLGRIEDAKGVAGVMRSDPSLVTRRAGAGLLAVVAASQARFGSAIEQATAVAAEAETVGM